MPRLYHAVSPAVGSPHVFIATPSTNICGNYTFAVAAGIPRLMNEGVAVDYCLLLDNCHVDDARNSIVRAFLMTDCTDLVFIDADVGFRASDLIKLCLKMDKDIVGGVYPFKSPDGDEGYPVRVAPGVALQADEFGDVQVLGMPTGFLKIRRWVIEALYERSQKFMGRKDNKEEIPHGIIFERTYIAGERMSGDYAFCEKAKALGAKIWVDPTMAFSHEGPKEWTGCLGDYWKDKHKVNEKEVRELYESSLDSIRVRTFTADDSVNIVKGWGNDVWGSTPDLVSIIHDLASEAEGPILEAGCGISTVVMALANPTVQIHSLEHDPIWASAVREELDRQGINNVTIHCHKLKDYGDYLWYDISNVPSSKFAFVFCDGPPRNKGSRFGLFEQCAEYISEAIILMDDADEEHLGMLKRFGLGGRKVNKLEGKRTFAISQKEIHD